VAGLALATGGLFVVAVELLLQHAVGEAGLLLLLQLVAVLALLDPRTAVLARRVGALLEGGVAAHEADAEAARLLGQGSGVTGHLRSPSSPRVRRDGASAGGSRCAGRGSRPGWCRPRGRSHPASGSPSRGPSPGP